MEKGILTVTQPSCQQGIVALLHGILHSAQGIVLLEKVCCIKLLVVSFIAVAIKFVAIPVLFHAIPIVSLLILEWGDGLSEHFGPGFKRITLWEWVVVILFTILGLSVRGGKYLDRAAGSLPTVSGFGCASHIRFPRRSVPPPAGIPLSSALSPCCATHTHFPRRFRFPLNQPTGGVLGVPGPLPTPRRRFGPRIQRSSWMRLGLVVMGPVNDSKNSFIHKQKGKNGHL